MATMTPSTTISDILDRSASNNLDELVIALNAAGFEAQGINESGDAYYGNEPGQLLIDDRRWELTDFGWMPMLS